MNGHLFTLAAAVLCSGALAAVTLDETPAAPGEWGYRPLDGKVSAVDPPGFVFRPQRAARSYELQVATDKNMQDIRHEAKGLTLYCHCPDAAFGPGTYYWRFRFINADGETSEYSSVRSFTIDETAMPFGMPRREELLARIPAEHPRLFLRPEEIDRYRELAEGRLKQRWDGIVAACEKMLESPADTAEPPKYDENSQRKNNPEAWRKIWWGNRVRVVAVTNNAATLAFAYLLGGDERYAEEARRLILAACQWDPKGATGYRYNDEAGMPFAYYTARTYTWLHDYLSEEDRQDIRDCMQVRGKEIYDHLSGRLHIWRPYASHSNRAWHWLGEVATAFRGELEGADDWAWFALNVFFNSYPVWNDDAGGWHEGLAYWSSYLTRVTWWLATMKSSYGIDGYRKPFFANAGNFGLYVVPPGETMGGFGDLTFGRSARNVSSLMSIFARMAGNQHWQWLVENSGGSALPGGYMGFIYAMLDEVQAAPPTDAPSSVLFSGIGLAVLHNNLVNREDDVQFMLKSSPMGTQSHGYESQNTFLLSVAGSPVFIRTGRRDLYGSPHHKNWMWNTKSQNSILVDGEGQRAHSNRPQGEITGFATSADFDYVVGQAADGYEGRLDRFTRAALFIKPEAIVMFDALEAPEPSTYQWLLHSCREMLVDGQTVRATSNNGQTGAVVQILAPRDLQITQTDQFDPPPAERIKLTQWHLQAETPKERASEEFVSVIRPLMAQDAELPMGANSLSSENALGCEVELASGKAIVVWRKSGVEPISLGGISTDGEAACVVLDPAGKVAKVFVHGGETVSYDGEQID